jgi:hypothetical protein
MISRMVATRAQQLLRRAANATHTRWHRRPNEQNWRALSEARTRPQPAHAPLVLNRWPARIARHHGPIVRELGRYLTKVFLDKVDRLCHRGCALKVPDQVQGAICRVIPLFPKGVELLLAPLLDLQQPPLIRSEGWGFRVCARLATLRSASAPLLEGEGRRRVASAELPGGHARS